MLDVFNIATLQGCNIQIFYGVAEASATRPSFSWQKPRGVSNVYMLLIGAGGNGVGSAGGGSGAITVWYGSAANVPDTLFIHTATTSGGGTSQSRILYKGSGATFLTLLEVGTASGNSGGSAMTANQFAASGFFQSTAGQNGSGGASTASTTTFLSGGCLNQSGVLANYGYDNQSVNSSPGYFQMRPIIVGVGGQGSSPGGIGCGGGSDSGVGGPGMVLIASW